MPSPYEIFDTSFTQLICPTAAVHELFSDSHWAEGPAWFAAGRYLVFADAPNDRLLRFDATNEQVSVFRQPSAHANGNTVDRQGRLVTCEHGNRRVTRTEHDGSITVIADRYQGKRFNSPNDVVVKSDGSIWFTDPTYGIDSDYEGHKSASEIGACHVYRVDPVTAAVDVVCSDFIQPNGLAFSPDESLLYIADTGRTHGEHHPAHIRKFKLDTQGRALQDSAVFADCSVGLFDGFRMDEGGHLWTSAGDGVHVYHPDGHMLGKIRTPQIVANLCFGGAKRNQLFICATRSLYRVTVFANGNKTY